MLDLEEDGEQHFGDRFLVRTAEGTRSSSCSVTIFGEEVASVGSFTTLLVVSCICKTYLDNMNIC